MDSRLMKLEEVCAYLSLGPPTVRRMVAKGQLPKPEVFGPRLVRWDRRKIDAQLDGEQPRPK